MVGHDGVGADLDGKDRGQLGQALADPRAPVLEVTFPQLSGPFGLWDFPLMRATVHDSVGPCCDRVWMSQFFARSGG